LKKYINLSREFNIVSFGGWSYAEPSEGFTEEPREIQLDPGTLIDHFGDERGRFVSPANVAFEGRSLPRGTERLPYNLYKVTLSVRALAGIATAAFNMRGGNLLPASVEDLVAEGVITRVDPNGLTGRDGGK
jgi:hypothetical protein